MPVCLQCGACPLLLSCIGFFLAIPATAAGTAQEGTLVDASQMLRAVHGKVLDFQFKTSDEFIFTDSPPTCLQIQFLYSEEGPNSFSELWVHYKESDRKRHVEQIKLKYKDPSESGIGNTLFFQFPKPVYNGLISKDVEFQVREHNLCYSLKATLSDRCFIIVLPTISGDSRANDCVPTAELVVCQYENYKVSEDFGCLDYETVLGVPEVTGSVQTGVKEAVSQRPL
uniref:Putative secreted protein n=1 Tax=Ixodes ricinus TaxID=34613 RepID=V5H9E3_IXORI